MDQNLRAAFNADFTPDKYAALTRCVNETEKWPADFRISETPIFFTRDCSGPESLGSSQRISASQLPGDRFRHLRRGRTAGPAPDRAAGFPELVRVPIIVARLHSQSVSHYSAQLDLVLWRDQR